PFNWTVFVSDDEAHEFAYINLVRKVPRRYQPGDGFIARVDSPYLPLDQAIWVRRSRYGEVNAERGREAWNSEGLGFFRWFAVEPLRVGIRILAAHLQVPPRRVVGGAGELCHGEDAGVRDETAEARRLRADPVRHVAAERAAHRHGALGVDVVPLA